MLLQNWHTLKQDESIECFWEEQDVYCCAILAVTMHCIEE